MRPGDCVEVLRGWEDREAPHPGHPEAPIRPLGIVLGPAQRRNLQVMPYYPHTGYGRGEAHGVGPGGPRRNYLQVMTYYPRIGVCSIESFPPHRLRVLPDLIVLSKHDVFQRILEECGAASGEWASR